jgi:serine/threonine protein kinase
MTMTSLSLVLQIFLEVIGILRILLNTIVNFMNQGQINTPERLEKQWLARQVLIDRSKGSVYKVYDGRKDSAMYRQYQWSVSFIPNCTVYFRSGSSNNPNYEKEIVIIHYPYIEGSHYASNTDQIYSIIEKLFNLHNQDFVFGDIRASNIIFTDDDALFIDFDLMGIDSRSTYPPGFNFNINDGRCNGT